MAVKVYRTVEIKINRFVTVLCQIVAVTKSLNNTICNASRSNRKIENITHKGLLPSLYCLSVSLDQFKCICITFVTCATVH